MKKISIAILSFMFAIFGMFVSACGESEVKDIILSQDSVVIYLGETENNTAVVNALPKNVEVDSLSIFYDNSNITVTQSAKRSDGSFDLYITPNGNRWCEDVEVTVKAGATTQKTFLVNVIVPVEEIVASSDVVVPFDPSLGLRYNLLDLVEFYPEATRQTGVEFEIVTAGLEGKAVIEGDYLVLSEGYNLFDEELKLLVRSTEKSSVSKEFDLKIVPKTNYYVNQINMYRVIAGRKDSLSVDGYTLDIKNGNFVDDFIIRVEIPSELGILVDIDSKYDELNNIMQYMSVTSVSENKNGVRTIEFTFESLNLKTGVGYLYFNFFYENEANDELASRFVIAGSGQNQTQLSGLKIDISVPISGINVTTSCAVDAGGAYVIYNTYSQTVKGSAFTINAIPNNTTETIVISTIINVQVFIWSVEDNAYVALAEGDEIASGSTIYVAGASNSAGRVILTEKVQNGQTPLVTKEMNFAVQTGAVNLGFVDSPDNNNTSTTAKKDVAVECGNETGTLVYLYAPNTTLASIYSTPTLAIGYYLDTPGDYYTVVVTSNEVGVKDYTIYTANGFEIYLTVRTIQPITNVGVTINSENETPAGVGRYSEEDGSVSAISIKYGYSVPLNYVVDTHANISKIEYKFAEAVLGDDGYESAYAEAYVNFSKDTNAEYDSYATLISTQNIKDANLITATKAGKVVIKISIYGYGVNKGEVVISEAIVKYICVEIYNPAKEISSSAKTVELRAVNQLISVDDTETPKEAMAQIDLSVLSNGGNGATYSNLYLNSGRVSDDGKTQSFTYENEKLKYSATLNSETKILTIVLENISAEFEGMQGIEIFASDFYLGDEYLTNDCYVLGEVKKHYSAITYLVNIKIVQTVVVEDINVISLELKNISDPQTEVVTNANGETVKNADGSDKTIAVTYKTYERIYLDVSKSVNGNNMYKILTEVLPLNAHNKALSYTFVPDLNYSKVLVDVSSNDGTIYYTGIEGGTGYIYITPKSLVMSATRSVKIIIPITVADGNSHRTAFEITSLSQINNQSKHYVITTQNTLELTSPLFNGKEFKGGLYGKRYDDESNTTASIYLNGASLFDVVGTGATVSNITLYGTVIARGFVANQNMGTINDVHVTTYISDGVYIPSLLTASNDTENLGGIVGYNNGGKISNSSYAGSIQSMSADGKTATNVSGISINSASGVVENCEIIIAKFENVNSTKGRVVAVVDGENTYFVNGILNGTAAAEFSAEAGVSLNNGESLDGTTCHINDVEFELGGYKALGNTDVKYGIVFYFKAQDSGKQSEINNREYNIITISSLISANCDIKVLALNPDGTNCSFVSISGDKLSISGIGEFVLRIYSSHDYTTYQTIRMLSLYYFSEFGVYNNGLKVNHGDRIAILKGGREVVNSKFTASAGGIEILKNSFEVKFIINGQDGSNYVTGIVVGNHTINATWEGDDASLSLTMVTNYGNIFDQMINNAFLNGAWNVDLSKNLGTTKIEVSANEGAIEPKDSIVFEAIITTDIASDKIADGRDGISTIEITNAYGVVVTDAFDVYAGNSTLVENATDKYSFEISIALKDEYKYNADYVDHIYTVKIQACNSDESYVYSSAVAFKLTILPQTLTDVSMTLYNITSSDALTNNVSQTETPTSVLTPSRSGLLIVDLYPNYASFDYVEIVAESNTLARLAYRVQKQDPSDPTKYCYDDDAEYEALTDANGIRIKNTFTTQNNIQNIGTYYIMIFATNTLNQDAVFNITVNVFYDGEKLEENQNFTLYVKVPQAPQVNIDGKTTVYAYVGETLVANVNFPEEQILESAHIEDMNKKVVKDIVVYKTHVGTIGGYNLYTLEFTIPETYVISQSNVHLRLVVESVKVDRGESEPAKSELQIYLVDFRIDENSFKINNVMDGTFNISSIKWSELEMYVNLLANYQGGENWAVTSFIDNYYYENYYDEMDVNNKKGYVVGNNYGVSKSKTLATYLYYVNGNMTAPIATYKNGDVEILQSDWYSNILSFAFNDDKLQVKGGESTGTVPMMLQIYYKMPDGAIKVYEYHFSFVNSLYTTEDMPIEITDSASFLATKEEDIAQDYILANDIYLYDYEVMSDTSKITSLDGNNYTIHIVSFRAPSTTAVRYALFDTVSTETTIKNLSVNYYYLGELSIADEVTDIKVAGIAITNNGVIANSEVIAIEGREKTPTHSTFGLKVTTSSTSSASVNVAGFVLNNSGSITNSRVGGDNKLVTKYDYSIAENPKLLEETKTAKMFTIRAGGTLTGFVETNSGVIASSFAKNINIVNTYNKNETKITSGFVNTNDGTITMSYAQGVKANDEVQASVGGIEATGIMAGFAYSNNGSISDSYSNIMLHTSNNQVGRLGAGFVYYNAPSASIKSSYSFSSIAGNNTTQLNFVGITDTMQYNNYGTIKNCYFYITDAMEDVSIETLFNTDISTVKKVNDSLNFYGFSFASASSTTLDATWEITATGPILVSANDIAHSVRFKADKPNGGDSTLDYDYAYDDKYDYGTANNPIIIRNAKEFNGVFGGYKGTNKEIEDNYRLSTGKVYGAYRLVNNINLNELIIDQNETSDYKYNLASTSMTLSGENKETSNRTGSLNGNGLTISNLAISNSETSGSNDFGMFKSIENGASVSNLNIILAKGGIKADNTTSVGTIAGSVKDSSLVNIKISTDSEEEHIDVIGSNMVGGVVGRIVGNSYIFGIEITNVSAIATYYQSENTNVDRITANTYNRDETSLKSLSIAGGVAGVVDIYTPDQAASDRNQEESSMLFANVQNIKTVGGMKVMAFTVGGVFGFVGKYVIAKDVAIELTQKGVDAQLIAYTNGIAGGVVGYNRGFMYQVRAEHEKAWQTQIEDNISKYYSAVDVGVRDDIDRGNLTLFETTDGDVTYKPIAIGGLVGVLDNGVISIAYSKVNVTNKYVKYAGGVIGYINANTTAQSSENQYIAQLTQVYATGDVYAGGENYNQGFTGGVIGLSRKGGLVLDRVNGINMWSEHTLSNVAKNNKLIINQIVQVDGMGEDLNLSDVASFEYDNDSGVFNKNNSDSDANDYVYGVTFATGENYNISPIKNADGNIVNSAENGYTTIVPYQNYLGTGVDNGAQIDSAFTKTEWYETLNWAREATEVYPHIRFTSPSTVYDIYDKGDFWKFGVYGSNPEAQFVVRATELIDCDGHQTTYSHLAGSIIGLYPGSGFENLSVPLFKKATNATISSLTFERCSAPIVESSEGTTRFSNLSYSGCTFSVVKRVINGDANVANYAGVTYEAKAGVTFNNITFLNCNLACGNVVSNYASNDENKTQYSTNAGLLFAKTSASVSTQSVVINGISVTTAQISNRYVTKNNKIGILFGECEPEAVLSNVNLSDSYINLTIETDKKNSAATSHVGVIGGKAGNVSLSLITMGTNSVSVRGGSIFTSNETVYVGGFFGETETLTYDNSSISQDNTVVGDEFVSQNITVKCNQDKVYVGGLVGKLGNLNYSLSKNLIVGQGNDGKYTNITVNATNNTFVGGIAGEITSASVSTAMLADDDDSKATGASLVYNGNIIIDQTLDKEKDENNEEITETLQGFAHVGGIGGVCGSASLCNVVFGGTINFAGKDQTIATYYIGGVFGSILKENTVTLNNTYAIGEILLNGKRGDIKTSDTSSYVGGLVGMVGVEPSSGNTTLQLNNSISLTTIYNRHEMKSSTSAIIKANIDAIAHEGSGTVNGGTYVSALNLCASKFGNNSKYQNVKESLPDKVKLIYNGVIGSKLNPLIYANDLTKDPDEYFGGIVDSQEGTQKTISGPVDNVYALAQSSASRNSYSKVYVYFENQKEFVLDRQINLNNAVMFSDGGVVYSEKTIFNNIDKFSAVSGIVARVDISDSNESNSSAGFANTNNGVIYTSAAHETYVFFEDKQDPSIRTKFYGYLNYSGTSGLLEYVGGFVGVNNGYIFGSNSNMHIQISSTTPIVGGFAGLNNGTIDYSYASGYVSLSASGGIDTLDIFANKILSKAKAETPPVDDEEVKTVATATNAYTIFADLASGEESANITNMFSVKYETKAIENEKFKSGVTIYGTAANVGKNTDGYYECDAGYNNNYPILKGNAFENLRYLWRSSVAVECDGTSSNSGLSTVFKYYELAERDENGNIQIGENITIYNIISNIVVLSNVQSGTPEAKNNYVMARNMRLTVANDAGDNLINAYDQGTINGYEYALMNGDISSHVIGTLGSNGKIENLNIENLTMSGKATGFIANNMGTIDSCQIVGQISLAVGSESVGVLVGTNSGHIMGTTVSASIVLYGANVDYSFGTVAGASTGGKISSTKLYGAQIIANECEGERTITVGGIVGLVSNTTIDGCGIEDSEIYASSKNITYLGGIVGRVVQTSSIINCYVDYHTKDTIGSSSTYLIAGSEESCNALVSLGYTERGIRELDPDEGAGESSTGGAETSTIQNTTKMKVEYATNESYVGGIIGYVSGGTPTIKDCSVYANITARAAWKAIDQDTTTELFDSESAYKVVDGVIYVYREMTSDAYAGGICSNYISSTNTNYVGRDVSDINNGPEGKIVHVDDRCVGNLASYSYVSGGFTAWKPIAEVSGDASKVGVNVSLMQGLDVLSFFATGFGPVVALAIAGTGPLGIAIAIGVGLVGLTGIFATSIVGDNAIEQLETTDVYYTLYEGNSSHKFVQGTENTQTSTAINIQTINSVLGWFSTKDIDCKSLFTGRNQQGYDLREISKFTEKKLKDDSGNEVSAAYRVGTDYIYYSDARKTENTYIDYTISETKYDGISPSLNDEGNSVDLEEGWNSRQYAVYSERLNVIEGVCSDGKKNISLKTDNVANQALKFRPSHNITVDYINEQDNAYSRYIITDEGAYVKVEGDEVGEVTYNNSTTTRKELRTDDYDYKVNNLWDSTDIEKRYFGLPTTMLFRNEGGQPSEKWNSDGEHIQSLPSALHFQTLQDKDGKDYYYLKFTDATKWKNLAYTINSGVVVNEKGEIISSDSIDTFWGKDVKIDIDVEGDITVGTNTLEKFNGTINVESDTKFTGMKLNISNSTGNAGLIRYSNSATLKNVKYEGDLYISYGESAVVGDNDGLNNVGVIIGKVTTDGNGQSNVNINGSSVNIASINCKTYQTNATISGKIHPITVSSFSKVSSFGGIVGSVEGNVFISGANIVFGTDKGLMEILTYSSITSNFLGFGGVTGTVSKGASLTIGGEGSTFINLFIASDINAVGGMVGRNEGTLNINGSQQVNIPRLYVISSGNAYLGGAIGYTSGNLYINDELTINESYSKSIISADTLDGTKSVYTGGVIGYGKADTYTIAANISIGSTISALSDISYLYAGVNAYVLANGMYVIPSTASAGNLVGNSPTLTLENVTIKNFLAKESSINNNYSSVDWSNFGKSSSITLDSDALADIGFTMTGNTIGTYQYFSVDSNGNVTKKTSKLDSEYYNVQEIKYEVMERTSTLNDLTNSVVHEYYLTFTKTIDIKSPNIDAKTGTFDETVLTEYSSKIVIKYLIRIIPINLKATSSNEYMLQVILLNSEEISNYDGQNNIDGVIDSKLNVIYTCKFNLKAALNNEFNIEIDDLLTSTINLMRTIQTSNTKEANNTITIENYVLGGEDSNGECKTNLYLNVTATSVSLVESLELYSEITPYTYNPNNAEEKPVKGTTTKGTYSVTNTLFKCDLENVSSYAFGNVAAVLDKDSGATTTQNLGTLFKDEGNNTLTIASYNGEEFTSDIVIGGRIIPYEDIKYNGENCLSSKWYNGTINGKDFRILSVVCGEGLKQENGEYTGYKVTEFVFENVSTTQTYLYFVGKMSYTLNKAYTPSLRYQSLMPVLDNADITISDIYYNLSYRDQNISSIDLDGLSIVKTVVTYDSEGINIEKEERALVLNSGRISLGDKVETECSWNDITLDVYTYSPDGNKITINNEECTCTKVYKYKGVIVGYEYTEANIIDGEAQYTTTYYYVNSQGGDTEIVDSDGPLRIYEYCE